MRSQLGSLTGLACLAVFLVFGVGDEESRDSFAAPSGAAVVTVAGPMPGARVPGDSVQRVRSAHFDFYTRGATFPLPLSELGAEAERVYDYVTGRLGARPAGRIAIVVEPPGDGACGLRGLTKIDSPTVILKADAQTPRAQFLGVLAHELGHIVELFALGADPAGDVVLLEAVATWGAGDFWNDWQGWPDFEAGVREAVLAGQSVALDRPTVKGMNGLVQVGLHSGCERDLYYTQWAAFVDYLAGRRGLAGLRELMVRPGVPGTDSAGRGYVRADYQAVQGGTLVQLQREWLRLESETLY